MKTRRISIGITLLLSLFLLIPTQSMATPVNVDLELLLAVDISGSISASEYATQMDGYEAAFRDPAIINGIINGGTYHSIAVSLVFWSSANPAEQQLAVNWTLINNATTSNEFADAIDAITIRSYDGLTGLGEAIAFSAYQFSGDNGFEGDRWVIDVSGDGEDNDWADYTNGSDDVTAAVGRDYALNDIGIDTINALVFGNSDLLDYFKDNVIGGTDAFAIQVSDIDDFGVAVKDKLAKEITGQVPEPTTMLLLGFGLIGLAGVRRRLK